MSLVNACFVSPASDLTQLWIFWCVVTAFTSQEGGASEQQGPNSSPASPPAPPAPPAPKRVLVTANFGRGDRQDFRSYFASSIAEPSKLEEFRESVKAHLSDVCGLQGPIDDNELTIELKPGLSYRKSMGRLVAGMPLCPGSEAMDGFEVLVRYVGGAPSQPT